MASEKILNQKKAEVKELAEKMKDAKIICYRWYAIKKRLKKYKSNL